MYRRERERERERVCVSDLQKKKKSRKTLNKFFSIKIFIIKKNLFRKNDSHYVCGNNFKAKKLFKWRPMSKINFLIKKMIAYEIKIYNTYDKN